jgi:catechol 2,3-dioxygenase-like lactoylglutathione lyase family enzyme
MQLDSVQIGAPDLDAAERAYTLLLGFPPTHQPEGVRRFQLRIGAVELIGGEPGVQAIRFVHPANQPPILPESFHGIRVLLSSATANPSAAPATNVEAIDHVVVHSVDLDRAIALWRDQVGLRLALDRELPQRGVRLAFFRSGGITLEIAGPLPPTSIGGPDRFYGVTYRVADLSAWCERLRCAGLEIGPARPGHKPGSTVATVRSGTGGVPTLFLEDPSRAVPMWG